MKTCPLIAGTLLLGALAQAYNTTHLLELHKSLVEISSTSGAEANVTKFLESYLQGQGFVVETQQVEGNRSNVLAYLEGSRTNKVLVTSHLDTVPPHFPYERRGDEIWGRGSVDAKASIASQVIAVESLLEEGKIEKGDVALLYVVGEENTGVGMIAANDLGLSWESVIFGEPTELKLARGHKGGLAFNLTASGITGHSGYPETGRSAIDILARALVNIQGLDLPWSEEFGNTTVNIGTLEGGIALNVIADSAKAGAFVRIATESQEETRKIIADAVNKTSEYLEIEFNVGRGVVTTDYDIDGKSDISFDGDGN